MIVTYQLPGLAVTNYHFDLPLSYDAPAGETIEVFAREIVASEHKGRELPYLLFFQGGPGSASPRPEGRSGWLKRATEEYRVLLLDQRGTGLSTPVSFQTLARFPTPQVQTEYLTHFRADAIVRDAEEIRKRLLGEEVKWSVLGQSFGGFCVLRYLSAAPGGLKEAYITGGIPSLSHPAEDIYRAAYPRVRKKNRQFFSRYPHAQKLCQEIAEHLLEHDVKLPNGQRFTVEQFQQLGLELGSSTGMETIYYLLEHTFMAVGKKRELSYTFLHDMFHALSYHTRPIFSLLHEAIYCQGRASNWAAERVRAEFPEFNYASGKDFLFTGEMIYPWIFEQYPPLRPLKETAQLLAAKDDWPQLYDLEALARNAVPVAAAVYVDDMYVDFGHALETLERIPNVKRWITNEYEHDGLRTDGERLLSRLIGMLRNQL